eukprot:TRINITY_DN5561_c0_g1_i1.p1 TRINITY_DN5561_c0_g1~~TRINITY_DN5561_c0_g1_i1.p1  ORF type:complete len:206 (-),score=34.58 TRINITY_DN5561_c0_g1_i1:549-1166(-)
MNNGHYFKHFNEEYEKKICSNCKEPSKFVCSKCKFDRYCSKECQVICWSYHKTICERMKEIKQLVKQETKAKSESFAVSWLNEIGENSDTASKCVLKGIDKGYIEKDLNAIVFEDKCVDCEEMISVKLIDFLYQPDGQLMCHSCESQAYVTNSCKGNFKLVIGKWHNHCSSCPELGECYDDINSVHCSKCGGHYYSGMKCSCKKK